MEENILSLAAPSLLYCPSENGKAVKAVHLFVFPALPYPPLSLAYII